jgi:hypothetical protein
VFLTVYGKVCTVVNGNLHQYVKAFTKYPRVAGLLGHVGLDKGQHFLQVQGKGFTSRALVGWVYNQHSTQPAHSTGHSHGVKQVQAWMHAGKDNIESWSIRLTGGQPSKQLVVSQSR